MFPLLFINCPGKFSPSNWAWPQKETIPDILSVKSDAYLRGKIISANLIRKTNGNWYLLCIFAPVNFPVGEVLGRDLHFVASVKALITLKTKHSLRSEESCLEWSTGSLLWLAEICKTSKKIKRLKFLLWSMLRDENLLHEANIDIGENILCQPCQEMAAVIFLISLMIICLSRLPLYIYIKSDRRNILFYWNIELSINTQMSI